MGDSQKNREEEKKVREEEEGDGEEVEEGEIVGESSDGLESRKEEEVVRHPLEHKWTFWFDNPSAKSRKATWDSSMRPIFTFSTVEDFWGVYNNIRHPSKVQNSADFHCFKFTIEPKWEDPICANGGKWTMTFPKWKCDTSWLYTLLAMIGEQFDHSDEICGAVVSVRVRMDRIALWTKNASNEAAQLSIGRQWKDLLDYNDTIGYVTHEDAIKLDKDAKNCYSV